MLGVNTIAFFLKNLHENRVKFPEERNAFVLDHQHPSRGSDDHVKWRSRLLWGTLKQCPHIDNQIKCDCLLSIFAKSKATKIEQGS